jgi:hypothetical protein
MTTTAKAFLLYLVVALAVFAWMFRLDVRPVQLQETINGVQTVVNGEVITNRWFGTVRTCDPTGCAQDYPPLFSK